MNDCTLLIVQHSIIHHILCIDFTIVELVFSIFSVSFIKALIMIDNLEF